MESMLVDHRYIGAPRLPGYLDIDVENNNLLEKARAQIMWDRISAIANPTANSNSQSLTNPAGLISHTLPQLYSLNSQRGNPSPLPSLPAHLWSQWTALHGLNHTSLTSPHITPPPPHTSSSQSQLPPALVAAASTSSAAAVAAASLTRPLFPTPLNLHRFSPYYLPKNSQDSDHQS